MTKGADYDVIIVGCNITGLSTAWHLINSEKIKNIALIEISNHNPRYPMITGAPWEHFTRKSLAFGDSFAKKIWRFHDNAFEYLKESSFIKSIEASHFYRPIKSNHELNEIKSANDLLNKNNLHSKLLEKKNYKDLSSYFPEINMIQEHGLKSLNLDYTKLLTEINSNLSISRFREDSLDITSENQKVTFQLGSNKSISSEVCILTSQTNNFLPEMKNVFFDVQDQFNTYQCPNNFLASPFFFLLNNGYEWIYHADGKIHTGGANFLRKHEDLDKNALKIEPKIAEFFDQMLKSYFPDKKFSIISKQTGLLTSTCDEIPVIGPMFNDDRILVADGFMESEANLGFFAGKCLSQLIAHGKCNLLPQELWPKRLRSLEN